MNLCMHRIPGFCVNSDEKVEEKNEFWVDEEAREAGAYHWAEIAKRYRDIPNDKLSFNVVNEPGSELVT